MKSQQNKTSRITKLTVEADQRRRESEILSNITQASKERNEGNIILAKSTYTTTDNKTKQVAAVDFTTNPIGYEFKSFLRKFFAPIILGATLILTACETTGLNQISVKKIKNEVTGEVEEYRSIKISEKALENEISLAENNIKNCCEIKTVKKPTRINNEKSNS